MGLRLGPIVAPLGLLALVAVGASAQWRDRAAPDADTHVVGRIGGRTGWLFTNLRYESNDRAMRGAFGPRPEAGCDDARRQRALAGRTRGLFALRDALYSQQNHPIEHRRHSTADFRAQADRFRQLGLPLWVDAGPGALARRFGLSR